MKATCFATAHQSESNSTSLAAPTRERPTPPARRERRNTGGEPGAAALKAATIATRAACDTAPSSRLHRSRSEAQSAATAASEETEPETTTKRSAHALPPPQLAPAAFTE